MWQACIRKGDFKLIWGQVGQDGDGNHDLDCVKVVLDACVLVGPAGKGIWSGEVQAGAL